MRRRVFVVTAAAAVFASAARAQQGSGVKRIGVLMSTAKSEPHEETAIKAFVDALARHGWEGGRNLEIIYRWGAGDAAHMRAHAHELVTFAPDVILAKGGAMPALRDATATIPIVFVVTGEEAALSYAGEFAHPRRNMTGFATPEGDLAGKRLQLPREIAPGVSRVLYLWSRNVGGASAALFSRAVDDAKTAGIDLADGAAETPADVERAIGSFVRGRGDGLIVAFSAFTTTHRHLIIDLATRYRLPSACPMNFFVESGGLFSYGFDQDEMFREAAGYTDRILRRAATPADLPVQLPTRFRLVINGKTAKALGLSVPQAVLALADEVIE